MSYVLSIKPSAVKEIEAIQTKKDRQSVVAKIQSLKINPRPVGCQKLVGLESYRVRQGRYRIVYKIEDDLLTVLVVKVGDRKNIYRSL
ncbi:MAG: type II toxin-antitoxin system RelE/ParE family toxin [Nitrospirota bacterium]|mgnify:CR=1